VYRNRSRYCDVVTPGTGKTLTGVKLVYWYVDMNKQHARAGGSHRQVLYCGPSNSSVDVAASKLRSCLFANVDAELVVKIFQVNTHTHTTVLWPFFQDHPGELVPEENFWTLWCKGRITEADTLAIRLGATPSGLTSDHLHHPPIFYRPDALPAAQPTVSKH